MNDFVLDGGKKNTLVGFTCRKSIGTNVDVTSNWSKQRIEKEKDEY